MATRSSEARATASEVAELRASVENLTVQVQLLINAVDELTQEIQWRNNQLRDRTGSPTPLVLTSMPVDPAALDWEINRFTAADLPYEPPSGRKKPRQTLFD